MTTDRALLQTAARAAGMDDAVYQDMEGWGEVRYGYSEAIWSEKLHETDGTGYWNPLVDDGDALRLAAALNMEIQFLPDAVRCRVPGGEWLGETCLPCDTEHLGKAQRLAIVRCAASIEAVRE